MIKKVVLLLFFLSFLPLSVFAQEGEVCEGKVVAVLAEKEENGQVSQKLEVLVTKGSIKGRKILLETGKIPLVSQIKYQKGDRVLLNYSKNAKGEEVFYLTDFLRRDVLKVLFSLFVVLVVIVGGSRGVGSLLGMALSFLVIFKFILPQILAGRDPVLITIGGSLFVVPFSFYCSHGWNKKTTIALLGTLFSLVLVGLLARVFVEAGKLTGYASEEAAFLQVAKGGVLNMKGLLLAGIIIGALGVLDDITVSQAAIVEQLKKAGKMTDRELFARAMAIGKDHIASMVNTLILVYTGATLPLLLLFINNPHPFSEVINYEIVAEEIIRTLVASIGLILAVPITTFLAASVKEL